MAARKHPIENEVVRRTRAGQSRDEIADLLAIPTTLVWSIRYLMRATAHQTDSQHEIARKNVERFRRAADRGQRN